MQQLEEALVHARKEEKEAMSARRTLESELEDAQVNAEGYCLYPSQRKSREAKSEGRVWIVIGPLLPGSSFHDNNHPGLQTIHLDQWFLTG